MRTVWLLLGALSLCGSGPSPLSAQMIRQKIVQLEMAPATARPATEVRTPAADPTRIQSQHPVFFLRDTSQIAGAPDFDVLEVETAYGTLSVPRDQLVRVRFARRLPTQLTQRIETLVAQLGDPDFDTREASTAELQKIGAPAEELLRKASKSEDEETQSRAASILEEIQKKADSTPGRAEGGIPAVKGSDDEVLTARMTIRGKVLTDRFVVRSTYGELRIALADLSGITFQNLAPSRAKVSVTAQHQPPGSWVDTKLDFMKDQRFKVTATGSITVSNYGIASGPAGNTDWSGHATFNNFPMLSLVGKIGKKGQPFLVKASYSGKAKREGRLYLAVVAFSPYPTGAQGAYEAKIQGLGGQ